MPLTNCPECGRQISTAAEACPQCGHPVRPRVQAPVGPLCYSCSAPATTRCQSCGALSCVKHVQSIYAYHGQGGAYELRCDSCYSSAEAWKAFGWLVTLLFVLLLAVWYIAAHKVEPVTSNPWHQGYHMWHDLTSPGLQLSYAHIAPCREPTLLIPWRDR